MKYYCNLAYMLAVAILSLGFAACSDDDDYKPAPSVPEDCMQVYFSELNESEYEIAPEDLTGTTIDLTVMRLQTAQAASVPITAFQTGDLFVVPSSVEFAAGEDTATLSITLNEVASGEFSLRLAIEDEQYADPYKVVEGSPLFGINVEVVKWNLLGTGDYTYNSVFSGVDPGLELYQKEGTTMYKIPNWGGGIELNFICDEEGNITVPEQYIGADDSTYGAVYITSSNADASSYYDAATKTYYFNCRYIVSAGPFGTFYEKFELKNPVQ